MRSAMKRKGVFAKTRVVASLARRPIIIFASTMTAADIIRLATTVATVQCLCNLLFNKIYFSKEDYRRACDALDRANIDRALQDTDAVIQTLGVDVSPRVILEGTRHSSRMRRASWSTL